jgi:hypothetical protein
MKNKVKEIQEELEKKGLIVPETAIVNAAIILTNSLKGIHISCPD